MAKYRNKPLINEAAQWFENGDHPEDDSQEFREDGSPLPYGEGKIVKVYLCPGVIGRSKCKTCGKELYEHGWISENKHIVCPGDWIVKNFKGEFHPCKPDIFKEMYERV